MALILFLSLCFLCDGFGGFPWPQIRPLLTLRDLSRHFWFRPRMLSRAADTPRILPSVLRWLRPLPLYCTYMLEGEFRSMSVVALVYLTFRRRNKIYRPKRTLMLPGPKEKHARWASCASWPASALVFHETLINDRGVRTVAGLGSYFMTEGPPVFFPPQTSKEFQNYWPLDSSRQMILRRIANSESGKSVSFCK